MEQTLNRIQNALKSATKTVTHNLYNFVDTVPASASKNLVFPGVQNVDWTASFWSGMLNLTEQSLLDYFIDPLACNVKKNYLWDALKYIHLTKKAQLKSFERRITTRTAIRTHDLGFLYTLSAVANNKISHSQHSKEIAINAADVLMERYLPDIKIIQAWGSVGEKGYNPKTAKIEGQGGRIIIDCLMNLPLLFYAYEQTGNKRYYAAAFNHAIQSMNSLVRKDNTTFHSYFFDPKTGEPLKGKTHQGYADDSTWARGQAWGIYGFALAFVHTGHIPFLETACNLADWFIENLPKDSLLAYWDFNIPNEQKAQEKDFCLRDSSANAIALCGILEIVKQLPIIRSIENKGLGTVNLLGKCSGDGNCKNSKFGSAVYGQSQFNNDFFDNTPCAPKPDFNKNAPNNCASKTSAESFTVNGNLQKNENLHNAVSQGRRERYEEFSIKMADALIEQCFIWNDNKYGSNGLLKHGAYNVPGNIGVNECTIWGDYFFMEALVRLNRAWIPYW